MSSKFVSIEGFSRNIVGEKFPRDISEIIDLIKKANQNRMQIYPVSTGKNWGYGTNLPVGENQIVLNLKNLNQIIEINTNEGYAIIEPGVTQEQLYKELKGTNYYFDVTGSSSQTSILGNLLERGVGYNFQRTDLLNGLEVILGNGEIVKTGFWGDGENKLAHIYRHGIGPGLQDLFFQSNFGIVTKASIKLIKRPQAELSFSLAFKNRDLSNVTEIIKELKEVGAIFGITHLASKERFKSTSAPLLYRYLSKKQKTSDYDKIMSNEFQEDWYLVGKIQSTNRMIKHLKNEVKRNLKNISKVYFLNQEESLLKNKVIEIILGQDKISLLRATKNLRMLNFGIPTVDGVLGATWDEKKPLEFSENLENDSYRWIFYTVLAPLNGESAINFKEIAGSCASEFGFQEAITLNFLSENVLEAVISIRFEKEKTELAHKCINKLQKEFNQLGYRPYRININQMDNFVCEENSYWKVVKEIKKSLDPNNVISPGRYCLPLD